jgi:anti-sigma regulatory factor (Ser/Thr protein kinase)
MSLRFTTDLSAVRALVGQYARDAGLSETRVIDLVIAVSEVAANTVRHARSAGTLDVWQDGREIICRIKDSGFIRDPLAGQRMPAPGALSGYGLWLVHQVCDEVSVQSGETGTTIWMRMKLAAP